MKGCTAFLVNMMSVPDGKLVNADPSKLAAKYDLAKWPWGVRWCEFNLDRWRNRA